MLLFYLFVSIVFTCTYAKNNFDPLSDEFINHINSKQNLWTAGRNFHPNMPLSYFKRITGSLEDKGAYYLPKKRFRKGFTALGINFDARNRWPYCPTLNEIRDQGSCGSCWAVSAVSAMSDRLCIKSKGEKNFYFSEDDILSCCGNCGTGCDGGVLSDAWLFAKKVGTVSGGSYNSDQGCKPYEIPPCEHDTFGMNRPQCSRLRTPQCKKKCQPHFSKTYRADKKRIGIVVTFKNTTAMQMEMFKHGPITTSFNVFEDFLHYKSGIYRYTAGNLVGAHSVKLLGWGQEGNIKYWLAANSWNTDWGDNGFFKIERNTNHCGIEARPVAGNV